MSKQYNDYLLEHRQNVYKAFLWMCENIPEIFTSKEIKSKCEHQCCYRHDQSKYDQEEYSAYDRYFYRGNRSYEVCQDFNLAWLHHIHNNPHHWQHWVLVNDSPAEGIVALDMPDNYIIEMICDWWSFSWKTGNLDEIFGWYDNHKSYMVLSDKTRSTVEHILDIIRQKLETKD